MRLTALPDELLVKILSAAMRYTYEYSGSGDPAAATYPGAIDRMLSLRLVCKRFRAVVRMIAPAFGAYPLSLTSLVTPARRLEYALAGRTRCAIVLERSKRPLEVRVPAALVELKWTWYQAASFRFSPGSALRTLKLAGVDLLTGCNLLSELSTYCSSLEELDTFSVVGMGYPAKPMRSLKRLRCCMHTLNVAGIGRLFVLGLPALETLDLSTGNLSICLDAWPGMVAVAAGAPALRELFLIDVLNLFHNAPARTTVTFPALTAISLSSMSAADVHRLIGMAPAARSIFIGDGVAEIDPDVVLQHRPSRASFPVLRVTDLLFMQRAPAGGSVYVTAQDVLLQADSVRSLRPNQHVSIFFRQRCTVCEPLVPLPSMFPRTTVHLESHALSDDSHCRLLEWSGGEWREDSFRVL